ncbi:MAG: alanine racemase, partial [Thermoleophilia bacterium]|nr:alanine racemase [Thermoleophilia bacterium]
MSNDRALARIDLGAIRQNARRLAAAAGRAELMAVVKADGYGHGAVPVARAALRGGAASLGVVTAGELRQLREAGIEAPVLVMGPLELAEVAAIDGCDVVAWTPDFVERAGAVGRERGGVVRLHLKLDTGMGRLGARPEDIAGLVEVAAGTEGVEVVGVMTHFATADETEGPNAGFFREQLVRFRARFAEVKECFPSARAHAANSAAVLRDPGSSFDIVRCGIALYGGDPFGDDPDARGLRPALSLHSWLAAVKPLSSRDSAGYGRRYRAPRATRIGVIPIGYGDGYARSLSGANVLIGSR